MAVLDDVILQVNQETTMHKALLTYILGVKAAITAAGTNSVSLAAITTAIGDGETHAMAIRHKRIQ